jgi:hypothetical protein
MESPVFMLFRAPLFVSAYISRFFRGRQNFVFRFRPALQQFSDSSEHDLIRVTS